MLNVFPSHAKSLLAKRFCHLLVLTVPISSGAGNFCGRGGDSSPSGVRPARIPILMSPPSFFNQGAERYAPEIFPKAQSSLQAAENMLAQDSGKNKVTSGARQTIQFAQDARNLRRHGSPGLL
jgi:hypothetical protein